MRRRIQISVHIFPFKNNTVVVDLVRRDVIDAGHTGQQFASVRLVPDEEHHYIAHDVTTTAHKYL